jgi:hypothetical protein
MTTREFELLQRAEAAERAVIEAVRQRDMLLDACRDTLTRLEWFNEDRRNRSIHAGMALLRHRIEQVQP